MYDNQFESYFTTIMVAIYPYDDGVKKEHVMLNIDCGMGKMNIKLDAWLKNLRFVLLQGLPVLHMHFNINLWRNLGITGQGIRT